MPRTTPTDHRTDALSSFVALGGLVGTGLGFPMLDSIAGLAVAAMVTRVGAEMGYSAIQELVSCLYALHF